MAKTNTENKFTMSETLILGAALFAMFFGAGNVIFPPSIGLEGGDNWLIGAVIFILASMGIGFVGILAILKIRGKFSIVMNRVSPKFTKFLMLSVLLIMGPLYIVPRTAALAYELGIGSIVAGLGGNLKAFSESHTAVYTLVNMSFASLYVIMVLVIIFNPSKIIDVIGKYLTPCLVTILLTIIIVAVINPIGNPVGGSTATDAAVNGFKSGYQTMDGISVMVLAPLILNSIREKKPKISDKELGKTLITASLIAIAGIAVIYIGMAYVGSQLYGADLPSHLYKDGAIELSYFVDYIANEVMGSFGRIIFGTAVVLACYTTAIAFTSTPAKYVAENTWNQKYSYKQWAIVFGAIIAILATVGVNELVVLAGPALEILFPAVIVIYFLSFVSDREDVSIIFVATMFSALAFGAVAAFAPNIPELQDIVDQVPLGSYGLVWFLPTLAIFVLMWFAFEYMGIDKEEQRKRNKLARKAKKLNTIKK